MAPALLNFLNVTKSNVTKYHFLHLICLVSNSHTLISTQPYQPHDNPLIINNNQLATLLKNSHLQVGHQVTQQLLTFHAVGLHPVTLFHPTNGQRELHCSCI